MISTVLKARPSPNSRLSCARVALAAMALACAGKAGTLSFDAIPSGGAIFGSPGASIGWGYTLANTSSDTEWLVTTGLSSDAFLHGTPNLFFDFPIVGPGTSLNVPFSDTNLTGLYQLIWDADAPIGFTNIGSFQLSAEWWSGDPGNGGVFLSGAEVPAVSYSAEVVAASPEPGNCLLVALTLAALLAARGGIAKLYRVSSINSMGGQR